MTRDGGPRLPPVARLVDVQDAEPCERRRLRNGQDERIYVSEDHVPRVHDAGDTTEPAELRSLTTRERTTWTDVWEEFVTGLICGTGQTFPEGYRPLELLRNWVLELEKRWRRNHRSKPGRKPGTRLVPEAKRIELVLKDRKLRSRGQTRNSRQALSGFWPETLEKWERELVKSGKIPPS